MAGGTVRTIPSRGDSNSDAFQSLCLHLLWRTLRCPGIDRDTFFLTGPSLLSRGTLGMVRDRRNDRESLGHPSTPPSLGKNFLLTFPFIEPARREVPALVS